MEIKDNNDFAADRPQHTLDGHEGDMEAGNGSEMDAQTVEIEISALKTEIQMLQDRALRQAADFQNFRRRAEQERDASFDRGRSEVVQRMLDLLDDFGRSLEASDKVEEQGNVEAAYKSLKDGVGLVYRKFNDELSRLGVEAIEAVGKPFDEQQHEAVMQQPAQEGTEAGTVVAEFQKGYRIGDRVIRHSKVVVAA